jgi:hypothetical protein
MLRSRGLGRLMNPRRIPLTLGTAAGAAFAAALIGVANAPAARADTEPDPLEDLFGTAGINSWTASADSSLLSSDPTLAGSLDPSVDNFLTNVADTATAGISPDDSISNLVYEFDPTSFSLDGFYTSPGAGGLPIDSFGDLAVGLDYTLFASGIPEVGTGIADLVQIPYDIALGLLYLPLLPFILAGA